MASRLRAVLTRVEMPRALVRLPGQHGYRLDVDRELVDLHRFRRLVRSSRAAAGRRDHAAAVELLEEALDLWHDEPLTDLHTARSEQLRLQVRDELLDAQRALAGSQLSTGRHLAALALLEPLVRANELDEVLARHWVTALAAAGQHDDAHAFLATFRRRFRQQMRVETSVGLPPATSPAPFAGAGPRQLPTDVGDFVGHAGLLAELDALTGGSGGANVVAISGMPGIGKTTLAVHWAHRRRDQYPDGHLYLDANAYGAAPPVDPGEALGRFLRALDVPPDRIPPGVEQRRDRLNRLLNGRRVLIILDNVRNSDHVLPLLTTSSTCLTVITSRDRLTGLTVRHGVRTVTVPPLPDANCVTLFGRMVGAGRAGAEAPAVRALARLSGGLPLAVRIIGEHVAARPYVPIADLVGDLAGQLLDLDGDEEASLPVVFAWSYDALRPGLARLFRLLGLHPGRTVSTEAAAALLGEPVPQAQRLLDGLTRTHLIGQEGVRRYRFHDLVRRFAHDRAVRDVPPPEREAALDRLLDWALLTAANAAACLEPAAPPVPDLPAPTSLVPVTFAADAAALAWCEAERENLMALTRWAADHGRHRRAWQLPGVLYEILDRSGRPADVLDMLTIAVAAAERDGHAIGRIGSMSNHGAARFALHDHRQALDSFAAALQLARSVDDPDTVAYMLHNMAAVHLHLGEVGTATTLLGQVLGMARGRADRVTEAAALQRLGDAHRATGRYDQAADHYRQALELRERLGSPRGQAITHCALATLHLATAQHETALRHCRLALDLHERAPDEAARCDTLSTAADAELLLGRHRDAERTARAALALGEAIDDPARRVRALAILADVLAESGRSAAAEAARAEARELMEDLDEPELRPLRERVNDLTHLTHQSIHQSGAIPP
ncbi:tetratricopeptide repeat protein [Dactylosporangium sp. NPDC005572]|uniref:ATP-binding protein n=1 Tax=Dactylosporangium sp. NPDC005572 TaxID=3156889 RepID=UPI0033A4725A